MLDIMYDVPMKGNVKDCRITKAVIAGQRASLIHPGEDDSRKIA
jgi:ATP-dependent protease Clp ATPase subunit